MAAEVVVSVVSEALINKLISIASQDIGRVFLGVKGEFTKLHRTLSSIQAVLSDAEKKQIEDKAVKDWLTKLNEVAYDIEDIVDEFEYEALRRKLEIRGRVLNKVRNFFSLSNPLAFRFKMASKIKNINEMLDEITRDKERFQFSPSNIVNCFANKEEKEERETSSHVDDSKIVGRELDKSKVTDILVNNTRKVDNFSVVRIVGMGGVGKTTLAQLVFNDKLVKDHFDTRMWVCVSDNSTEKTVYSNLLESINGKKSDVSSLDVMLSSLKESLGRKKYLIVLDDVWNDGKIDRGNMFSILLSMGVEGSRIIVTTRTDEDIPSMMGSIYTHRLVGLSEIECWSIFEKIAFGNGGAKKSAELINIGKEIVKKCGGVPLAAKTLGGMMYSTSDENEWLSIQKSEIWSLPEGEKKILCVLKLSYDRFSPQLKRCFSYCSIFPKDHKIKKMKLIQLWMAEGFLTPSSENEALGNIGKKYINILLQNSFIEGGHRTFIGKKAYKMHDLVHDLALSVSGMEYSLSDSWTIEGKETERLRHVRLVHKEQVSTIPKAIYRAKKLRTFVYITREFVKVPKNVWGHMFLNFNYLRVMDLRRADIEELPPSIGKLKHLRYLDLSRINLTNLPDSVSSLYNLQTLILRNCFKLKEFPKNMKKLRNLRNLIIHGCRFIHMPREVGKLSLLERLCVFVVGKDNGYGIEELKDLRLLGGKLEIHSLENVRNGGDAKKANLKEKPNIRNLDLNWMYEFGNPDRVGDHYAVLEGLQPHRNLKELSIRYYFATEFPTWIASHLLNLVSLSLWDCDKCEYLPALGELPCLQYLYVQGLKALKRIGSEFYGNNGGGRSAERVLAPSISLSFPSLKELSLIRMHNLEEWLEDSSTSSSSFPCLERLVVSDCSSSITTPTLFPSLKHLQFEGNVVSLLSLLTNNQESLVEIQILNCVELMFLPQSLVCGNNVLEHLNIGGCKKFEAFLSNHEEELETEEVFSSSLKLLSVSDCPVLKCLPNLRGLNSLQDLSIVQCGSLKLLPDGLQCLRALERLTIRHVSEELDSFPFPIIGPQVTSQCFVSLRRLEIQGWHGLESLPDQLQHLILLQELIIKGFHSLVALPEWLGNMTSLRYLQLYECENLMYLPSQEQMRPATPVPCTLSSFEG